VIFLSERENYLLYSLGVWENRNKPGITGNVIKRSGNNRKWLKTRVKPSSGITGIYTGKRRLQQ